MLVNFQADIDRAIQLTLDAWRNSDGSILTAGQRAALANYLASSGSGPGGQGSYVDWLTTQIQNNPQFIDRDNTGQPSAGTQYIFFGGQNNREIAEQIRANSPNSGWIEDTPWARFANDPERFDSVGAGLQNFVQSQGWNIRDLDGNTFQPENFTAAISDMSWGTASAGYARAAVLYGNGAPIVINSDINDNRILGQIELPILAAGGQRINGLGIGAGVTFNDVAATGNVAIADARGALGPTATNTQIGNYIANNGSLTQGTASNASAITTAQLGDVPRGSNGTVSQNDAIDALVNRAMQDLSRQPNGPQAGTQAYNDVRDNMRNVLQGIGSNPDIPAAFAAMTPQQQAAANAAFINTNIKIGVPGGLLGDTAEYLNTIYDAVKRGDWGEVLSLTAEFGASSVISAIVIGGSIALAGLLAPELAAVAALGWLAFGVWDAFTNLSELFGKIASDLGINGWLSDIFGSIFYNRDPLILDLDGGGVSLTSLGLSNAYFDLNGNGFAERTGWVRAGDGLLALDVNNNGRIDNGTELFGTARQNGFAVLARYDDNRDGRITSADAVWSRLLVWRDNNGDGVSAAAELSAAAANDIGGIGAEAIAVA